MRVERVMGALLVLAMQPLRAVVPKPPVCRTEIVEGEVTAGQPFLQPIGQGLRLLLQPIDSGWILRIVAADADLKNIWRPDFRDYALLATPPYRSISPLSISTDFSFRAQDAVGWNPRRFRFATSPDAYRRLNEAYDALLQGGATPAPAYEQALATEVAHAAEGVLHLVDARLAPGTADQWRTASAVSFNFSETAHTLVQEAPPVSSPLGRLLWIRFRIELELPPEFRPDAARKVLPHLCGTR